MTAPSSRDHPEPASLIQGPHAGVAVGATTGEPQVRPAGRVPGRTEHANPLGLPAHIEACIFDLDGVLTDTADLHFDSWRQVLDSFLCRLRGRGSGGFTREEFAAYVDGRPYAEGLRCLLRACGAGTVSPYMLERLCRDKNDVLLRLIAERGVNAYPGSVRYVRAVLDAGLPLGVVTSSANAAVVLDRTCLGDLVPILMDGGRIERLGLRGKPAPDPYLAATAILGAVPRSTAVFEDALSGVTAAKAGRFGYIVGLDRMGQADSLWECGADVVVDELSDLMPAADAT